jgi:hypothetical protein
LGRVTVCRNRWPSTRLALKRNRQGNGSDGDKQRSRKKAAGLQRNRQRHRSCQQIED